MLLIRPCLSRVGCSVWLPCISPSRLRSSTARPEPNTSLFHPKNAVAKNTLTVFPPVARKAKVLERKDFLDTFIRMLPGREIEKSEALVDQTALKLYTQCSAGVDYLKFIKAYHFPDIFDTWLRMTLLHLWMALARARQGVNEETFIRLRDSVLVLLWDDVKKRLDTLSKEWKTRVNTAQNHVLFDAIAVTVFTEMDEGFLGNDKELCACLWRSMYDFVHVDPIHLVSLVKYTRQELYMLDNTSIDEFMVKGVSRWR